MNCVIRVDSAAGLGMGHVSRCLNLAEVLRASGCSVVFVCREHAGHFIAVIDARGFQVRLLPGVGANCASRASTDEEWLGQSWREDAEQTIAHIQQLAAKPDWLIIDHYGVDERWQKALRPFVERILVIDDLANRPHSCDVLLDQNLVANADERYSRLVNPMCVQLLGAEWALLHQDYAQLHEHAVPRKGMIKSIFMFLGGSPEPSALKMLCRCVVETIGPEVRLDVVVGSRGTTYDELDASFSSCTNVHLHGGLSSLALLMLQADCAIASGGVNTWERLCLGLPTLLITVADNQRPAAIELQRLGVVNWLGPIDTLNQKVVSRELASLLTKKLDPEWSQSCLQLVDGKGAARVKDVLTISHHVSIVIRSARLNDEELLLRWANDPVTRRNALQPAQIDATTHRVWFRKRMGDVDGCWLFIAESETGFPIGQVRFELSERYWEIHYAVSPLLRGRGLGRMVLAAAMQCLLLKIKAANFLARVKDDNVASRRIFEGLGFELCADVDSILTFRKSVRLEESTVLERPQ